MTLDSPNPLPSAVLPRSGVPVVVNGDPEFRASSPPSATYGISAPRPPRFATIQDLPGYLATRRPAASPAAEEALFARLSQAERARVSSLLDEIFPVIAAAKNPHQGIQEAVRAWPIYRPGTLRKWWDAYAKTGDWFSLVDARKGADWGAQNKGLPREFLVYVAQLFASRGRSDARRAAIRELLRVWQTGRNLRGEPAPVPGYGLWRDWFAREFPGQPTPSTAVVPEGWSYENIMSQIRRRGLWKKSVALLCQQGIAAAHAATPHVLGTRTGLRFLEEVQFDDVKVDFRVFDPKSGGVMDLWLLVAHDKATALKLGFGMRPARSREDGTQEHLRLVDMKQLAGWLLERWGLPPYPVTWKVENGTATFNSAASAALGQLFGSRLKLSFARMIGGRSPVGYQERGVGNSKGKASIESSFRLLHTDASGLPAQVGRRWDVRPQDLGAREKESVETWKLAQALPTPMRGAMEYPILTLGQARQALFDIFGRQNARTEHDLEGFEDVLEWRASVSHDWLPVNTAPYPFPDGAEMRKRKESPWERALRLANGLPWTSVSPHIVAAFYAHTQKWVEPNARGEIAFDVDGKALVFAPVGERVNIAGKVLAYFHPDDPRFLHLTKPDGAYLSTWLRRERVHRSEDVSDAIEYTEGALKAVRAEAAALAAPQAEALQAMRARNADRLQWRDFVDVAAPVGPVGNSELGSPLAAGLAAGQANVPQRTKAARSAADVILTEPRPVVAAADDTWIA